jgi:hypothetical protein
MGVAARGEFGFLLPGRSEEAMRGAGGRYFCVAINAPPHSRAHGFHLLQTLGLQGCRRRLTGCDVGS